MSKVARYNKAVSNPTKPNETPVLHLLGFPFAQPNLERIQGTFHTRSKYFDVHNSDPKGNLILNRQGYWLKCVVVHMMLNSVGTGNWASATERKFLTISYMLKFGLANLRMPAEVATNFWSLTRMEPQK